MLVCIGKFCSLNLLLASISNSLIISALLVSLLVALHSVAGQATLKTLALGELFNIKNPQFSGNYPPGFQTATTFDGQAGYRKVLECSSINIQPNNVAGCPTDYLSVNTNKFCPASVPFRVTTAKQLVFEVKSQASDPSAVGSFNCTVYLEYDPCQCGRTKAVSTWTCGTAMS